MAPEFHKRLVINYVFNLEFQGDLTMLIIGKIWNLNTEFNILTDFSNYFIHK